MFNGPINGTSFRAWVEQLRVLVLRPGDIVVMDNLGSHKTGAIQQMIQVAGARLWYLQPYLNQTLNAAGLQAHDRGDMAACWPPRLLHPASGMYKRLPQGRLRYRKKRNGSRLSTLRSDVPWYLTALGLRKLRDAVDELTRIVALRTREDGPC